MTTVSENFDNKNYNLHDGVKTPDGSFFCLYKSNGIVDTRASTDKTKAGKVLFMQPEYIPNQTRSCLVTSTKDFKDMVMNVDIRTVAQTRSPTPNSWETAWLMWHFTDDWHHYYLNIASYGGGLEVGRKDYSSHIEQQIFLITNPKDKPVFTMGKWYHIKIKHQGNHIQIWIDGVLQCDIVDNGSFGKDSSTGSLPNPPTDAMYHGYQGFYCEDAACEYDNFSVRAL